jgi:site-specific DNA-methyltransferase (adenine-specific)
MMPAPYYADEAVTLYLGDCRASLAWLGADVLVTDPPYGIRWERRIGATSKGTRNIYHDKDVVIADKDTAARDNALELWGDRPAVIFGSWRMPRPPAVRNLLIWHKAQAFSGPTHCAFFTNHDEIYILGEGRWRKSSPPLMSVITTGEHRTHAAMSNSHPASKPVPLMELLIDRCPPGVIADPFTGSGTTLIAARNLGRRAIGIEVHEPYAELAARRLSQLPLFSDDEATLYRKHVEANA